MKIDALRQEGYQLLHDGIVELSRVEANGIRVDVPRLVKTKETLKVMMRDLRNSIEADDIWKVWRKRYGEKSNLTSRDQLGTILHKELGYEVTDETETGRPATDEEALQKIDNPFVTKLIRFLKYDKTLGTFVKGIEKETIDGRLHPVFNLHFARTYRSCVAKGTMVEIIRDVSREPKGVPIEEVKAGDYAYCYDNNLNLCLRKVVWAGKTGHRKVVRVHWNARGKRGFIDLTPEHLVRLADGRYTPAHFLNRDFRKLTDHLRSPRARVLAMGRDGEYIYQTGCPLKILDHRFIYSQLKGNVSKKEVVHHKDGNHLNNGNLKNLQKKTRSKHSKDHALNGDYWTLEDRQRGGRIGNYKRWGRKWIHNHRITKVEEVDEEVDVYDIEVEEFHNFIANEICVHNSSDSPNFQNFPVRDKEMSEIVRSLFIASKGHVLVENDFKGAEVVVSACYHKDPNFISYITTPGKDMHKDMAAQIYMLKPEQVDKDTRYGAKNRFVFPQFYGDFYVACARNLWEWVQKSKLKGPDGKSLYKHLQRKGINELGDCNPEEEPRDGTFEKHLKEVEDDFWNNRFMAYGKWRKDWYRRYLDKGYFDLLTGFRVHGSFNRNSAVNYPVQGSAFHCLLWALIRVNRMLVSRGMKSMVVGQIHDSLIGDVAIDELKDYLEIVERVVTVDLPKAYRWLIVPLEIEYEIAPERGNWFQKKETKFKKGKFFHPDNPNRFTTDPVAFLKTLNHK